MGPFFLTLFIGGVALFGGKELPGFDTARDCDLAATIFVGAAEGDAKATCSDKNGNLVMRASR